MAALALARWVLFVEGGVGIAPAVEGSVVVGKAGGL